MPAAFAAAIPYSMPREMPRSVNDACFSDTKPSKPGVDPPLPLGGVVVVQDAGLRIEQVRGDWGFAPRKAIADAPARIFDVARYVARERALQDDEPHQSGSP